jgi:hypothetical protein
VAGDHKGAANDEPKPKTRKKPSADSPDTQPAKRSKPSEGSGSTKTTKTAKSDGGKGAKVDGKPKAAPATKAPASAGKPAKQSAPAKDGAGKSTGRSKKTSPEVKDIRSEAQAGKELAYDVGDKIGGARKDEFRQHFIFNPTPQTLAQLEKEAPELAQVSCVKKNVLPAVDFEAEWKRGTDINTAVLKQLIYDRIAPKPQGDTPEDRMKYLSGIRELHRVLQPMQSWEEIRGAIRELGGIARDGRDLAGANHALSRAGQSGNTYTNVEYYTAKKEKGEAAKKMLDFEALGEKLNNFFTDYDAVQRTIKTVHAKNLSWDTYFKTPEPSEEKAPKEKGAQKKKWERMAVNEHMRTGGKETTVKKPEDIVKQFGMKGVEFGHWVDDSSGLFHLKRSAEAFSDLAEVLGIENKDISLNGRLSMAFGARGKGGALAHYEPDRKVINMTKMGGAGSLAHEWGHALDNILYQYSHGGRGSIMLASEGDMGDHDPTLKALYDHLMDTITKPPAGEKGGTKKIMLDSSTKLQSSYYPTMRRDAEGGMSAEELYHKWSKKFTDDHERTVRIIKTNSMRSPESRDKAVKSEERKYKIAMNGLPHMVASEMRYATVSDWKKSGEHFKQEIEISTGKSEYMTRCEEMDGNGKSYFAQNAEMFARVFESHIEDTMKAKKRKNNYLVWGTGASVEAPFPIGNERKAMHGAMDALLDYVANSKALKKALKLEILSGITETDLQKSHVADFERDYERLMGKKPEWKPLKDYIAGDRYAYRVPDTSDVFYIPVNRLNMVYQTDEATDWDKVKDNMARMQAGEALEPVMIGYDYDVHDGHHRWIASKELDYSHVPCVVRGTNALIVQAAKERYSELWKSFDESKHPRQKDGKFGTKDTSEEGKLMIFHGTALVNADKIKEKGFKAQWSGNGDLGKCAYFKSPAWDKHETDDFGSSENVVNRFAEGIKEEQDGCVIKAQIDAKHVLDCSKGRPQELQDMIDALKPKGARGKATPKWDKKSSPYEAYAKKHGIKVIVDKLDTGWEDEGYQIGVYDPKIIQILEVGKSLKGGELQKALATGELPYCLLHHEFDKDGNLILHIGATSEA